MRTISTKPARGKRYQREQEKNAKRSAAMLAAADGGQKIVDIANAYGVSHQRASFIVNRERNRRHA
jgi:hypothetical protein